MTMGQEKEISKNSPKREGQPADGLLNYLKGCYRMVPTHKNRFFPSGEKTGLLE